MILIFDLDGTVLNTYELIRQSFIYTFKTHLPDYEYTEEELQSYFGPTLDETFSKFSSNPVEVENMIATYREFNLGEHHNYVSSYPGAKEVFDMLKSEGYQMTILSNKRTDAIMLGLEILDFRDYFEIIIGSDLLENVKPHPEGIEKILSYYNTKDAIMIGDTAYDMQAAQNADIISIGVSWALTSSDALKENGASYIADDYQDIYKIIKEVHKSV